MKNIVFVIILFAFGLYLPAQTIRTCATMEYLDQLMIDNPHEAKQILDIIHNQVANPSQQRINANGKQVITIPVVVHVIYNEPQENLPYSQILSQIQVLNEDFRRLNADTTNTPSVFQAVAADAEIEFCLAAQDPNGNYTFGITRTATNVSSFTTGNRIKTTSQGGKDGWPSDKYLNIWVGDLGNSLLGYATFPGGNPLYDGIVIHSRYFGRYGSAELPFHLGRTGTHEVGHWLGLRHIWGDGGCGVDDGISDTPLSDAANYQCPDTHISCGSLDMVQNYMDYTDDACMNIYTLGQKTQMQNIMNTVRSSLITSIGCQLPLLPPFIVIAATDTVGCIGQQIQYLDQSLNNPFKWQWIFQGGTANNDTIQNPIVTYDSAGIYSVTLIATNIYGTDTVFFKNFIRIEGAEAELPLYTGFENELLPPFMWSLSNPNGDRTFKLSNNNIGGFGTSNTAAFYDGFTMTIAGRQDLMVTPKLDFTNVQNPYIAFDVAYITKNDSLSDTLVILYSTDCGDSYFRYYSSSGTALSTAPKDSLEFIPTSNQWRRDSIDLSFLEGKRVVKIAIGVISGGGNNLYLDNIMLGQPAKVAPEAAFTVAGNALCIGQSITFIDSSQNDVKSWYWEFPGGTPATSTEQYPIVNYNIAGTFDVKLKVVNAFGADSIVLNSFITIHPAPQITVQAVDILCNGSFTGGATVILNSGTPPFFVTWATGSNSTIVTGLPAGSYKVTVSDANNCSAVAVANINQPPPIIASVVAQPEIIDSANGSATLNVTGGVPPYTYLWNDPQSQNTAKATGLEAGNYAVTITDANNCVRVIQVIVPEIIPIGIADPDMLLAGIYPNPTSGNAVVKATWQYPQDIEIIIYNSLGQAISKKVYGSRQVINEEIDFTTAPAGLYFIAIKAGEKLDYFKIVKE